MKGKFDYDFLFGEELLLLCHEPDGQLLSATLGWNMSTPEFVSTLRCLETLDAKGITVGCV